MRLARTAARFAPLWLLGAVALAAPVLANDAMPRVWGAGECSLEWCQPTASEAPTTDLDAKLQEAADVARLSEGRGCVPAGDARPGVIPAEMVLRDAAGDVVRVTWTYPAPVGSWVWALCYGD